MSTKSPKNVAASVRQRLLNRIRQSGQDANLIWSRYATERLLYRLSVSEYSQDFVLKGAVLFMVWLGDLHRPTMDVDLLGRGEDSGARMEDVFRRVCDVGVPADGLRFDPRSVKSIPIRRDQQYHGQRVTLTAYLGKARIPLQVDVGFGDAVVPKARTVVYPTLLDLPPPRLRAYRRETVVAEKLHAMVSLGMLNSRMKDFYDLYFLARQFAFEGATVGSAIRAAFERRRTAMLTARPLALTAAFGQDASKQTQWRAFLRRSAITDAPAAFADVVAAVADFLGPVLTALAREESFHHHWAPGGPWR